MKDIEELVLTPFSEEENNKDYTLTSFTENGENLNVLRDLSHKGISSGTLYKFGLEDENGNKFWFLNAKPHKSREKARKIFNLLEQYVDKSNIKGVPFIIKKK